MIFTEVSTKNIKSLSTEKSWLCYGCTVMGQICKYDSKKFCFQPSGAGGWSFIEYGPTAKIKEQLKKVRKESRTGRVIGG